MSSKYITTFLIGLISQGIFSQENKNIDSFQTEIVFENVEVEATFPGGSTDWKKFLEKNLRADIPVTKNAPSGTYKVIIQFIVHKDGSLSDMKALTNFGYGLEVEALRVMKKSPQWIPAIQNGIKVTAYRKQPITFLVGGL